MSSSSSSEFSEDAVSYTKTRLLGLLSDLEDSDRDSIERWISSSQYRDDLHKLLSFQKEEKELDKIAMKIRKEIDFEAELSSEKIMFPTLGSFSDCSKDNTCHIDEFLYDDETVDKLVKKGKVSRFYCLSCGSRNTKELSIVSHSMSRQFLLYIFKVMLPKDLSGQQVLDIGSRLGAVLYGAYHMSEASKIVGVEMNKELCELQERIITHFKLDPKRIQVVNSDIMNEKDIIQNSNVIIIHVFDFFVEPSRQMEMWSFFKSAMKKGTLVVTVRSIVETLNGLGIYEDFVDWLSEVPLHQTDNEVFFNLEDNDYSELYIYKVK